MYVYYLTIVLVYIIAFFAQETRIDGVKQNLSRANPFERITVSSLFAFLTFLILFLVAGLRWHVGTDYWQYARLYPYYSTTPLKDLFSPKLYQLNLMGIRIISIISRYIYDDSASMFFLASLITVGLCLTRIARASRMFLFSILLFIFTGSWHGSFNGVRQYLAMAVIFAGSNYIIEKRFWKYTLVVVLASLFHSSALVMLPIYFIAIRKTDYKQWLMLSALAIFMITSYNFLFKISEIVLGKEIAVMSSYMTTRVNILRVAVSWAPLLLYFLVRKSYKKDPESTFYLNMLIINAMLKIGTMNSAYLMRITDYTGIFTTLALPKLVECFDRRSGLIIKFVIIGLYAIFWYVEVSNTPDLYNFKWVFAR